MRSCFLFARQADGGWSRRKTFAYWLWNGALLAAAGCCLGAVQLLLAVGSYDFANFYAYFRNPTVLILNVLPVLLICILFYAITARAWIAFALSAVLTVGLSVGNYFKLLFRDDPLMMLEIKNVFMAAKFSEDYHISLTRPITVILLCVVFGTVVLFFTARAKIGTRQRIVCAALALAAFVPVYQKCTDDNLYDACADYTYLNQWASTQQYVAHGFIYPFIHSANDLYDYVPEGYDAKEIAALLNSYSDTDIPEDKKVNVIAVMLEAYADFSRYDIPGINFCSYDKYHALEEESYTGNLITNIFAAGTVDTERAFLTGYLSVPEIRSDINSYVRYFKSQGYTVEGSHCSYGWFYNRQNVNRFLGFDNYYFTENYYCDYSDLPTPMNNVLFPGILRLYEQGKENGAPYFSFNVTYEGHGPYSTETNDWCCDFVSGYDTLSSNVINNYLGCMADVNNRLIEFVDALREDEDPVVLVLFGDHKPWMGDGNSVYSAMGFDFDMETSQGFDDYYSTRYLIWANDAAKAVLGRDFRGEGPTISPAFLMSEVFEQCGWSGSAFMQAMDEVKDVLPVISVHSRWMENGVLTTELSQNGLDALQSGRKIYYYWKHAAVE